MTTSPHFLLPVIASITGNCIGGAVDVITACDLRYCTDDATFCIKETDLAMVADIGTLQRLPKLIGDQRSRELAYTSRVFSGKEAEKIGLVARSFRTEEELRAHVEAVAQSISEKSPLTIR
jgi:enoyl-CoA hydratase